MGKYYSSGIPRDLSFCKTKSLCLFFRETPAFVRVGATDLNSEKENTIKIQKFIKFPGYNITTIYNDIALVELEKEVK